MIDEERINPGHHQARSILRLVGPLVLAAGGLLMVIGMGSFFSSFGGFGTPRFFWCCFVAMPLLFVGMVMTKFGYMGAVMRYQAGEIAPVGKDAFNYLADGTQEGVQTIAAAVGNGMREGMRGGTIECQSCGRNNDIDAKFCDECGGPMRKQCPSCGINNEGDATFCDECGFRLTN